MKQVWRRVSCPLALREIFTRLSDFGADALIWWCSFATRFSLLRLILEGDFTFFGKSRTRKLHILNIALQDLYFGWPSLNSLPRQTSCWHRGSKISTRSWTRFTKSPGQNPLKSAEFEFKELPFTPCRGVFAPYKFLTPMTWYTYEFVVLWVFTAFRMLEVESHLSTLSMQAHRDVYSSVPTNVQLSLRRRRCKLAGGGRVHPNSLCLSQPPS